MSDLRAIIFDFDGVIADTEPLHFAALRQVLTGIDIALTETEYYTDYLGFDDRGVLAVGVRSAVVEDGVGVTEGGHQGVADEGLLVASRHVEVTVGAKDGRRPLLPAMRGGHQHVGADHRRRASSGGEERRRRVARTRDHRVRIVPRHGLGDAAAALAGACWYSLPTSNSS